MMHTFSHARQLPGSAQTNVDRARAAKLTSKGFVMLKLPPVMRLRIFLCITLPLLCHPQLWSQAVTKQFPPPAPKHFSLAERAVAQAASPVTTSADSTKGMPAPSGLVQNIPVAQPIPAPSAGVPVEIEAATQSKAGDVYTLSGNVVIHYHNYVIRADKATYNRATGDMQADGHLVLDGGEYHEHFTATHGTINLKRQTGQLYDVVGTLGVAKTVHNKLVYTAPNPFTITGREVLKLGPRRYRVLDGSMTACRLPHPDWRLLSKQINLADGKASASNTFFQLLHVPVLYLPYVTHPVNEVSRQSGILLPILGNDTAKGLIVGEEAYFVLSRSSDLTVGTEYFSKRGFAPMGLYRYRGRGDDFLNVHFHSLLDQLSGTANQGGVDLIVNGRRDLNPATRAVADIEYLSSYVYRQAFEESYAVAINSEVKSQAFLVHNGNGFSESAHFDRYQSFQNSSQPGNEIRILHLPSIQFDGEDHYLGTTPVKWGATVSVAGLSRSEPGFKTSREVRRADLYPHLLWPLSYSGWTLTPQIAVRDTFYSRSQNPGVVGELPTERPASLNRADIEGEIELRPPVVERDFDAVWLKHLLGGSLRHTLEPDVAYRYVTGIDNFNSVLRFDEVDVASDTSELDYSLTQRLFLRNMRPHPCKGDEALGPNKECGGGTSDWLSWQLAQKYFFNSNFGGAITPGTRNVLATSLDLTGVAFLTGPRNYSPIVSRLKLRTSSATDLEWDIDYDGKLGRITTSNVFAGYRWNNYHFTIGDARLNAPEGAALPSAPTPATNVITDYNQFRWSATYGSPVKDGLSAGTYGGYDFVLDQLQYGAFEAAYNWNCCGLSFEIRRYSLGAIRDDTTYLYSFTLAGVGSAGSLRRAERAF